MSENREKYQLITVSDGDDTLRLSRWFKKHYPDLPHALLEKLLRKGQIRIDGKRIKSSLKLTSGQKVKLPFFQPVFENKSLGRISKQDDRFMQSLLIYEDEHILALNKPSGLAVQGGSKTVRHVDRLLDAFTEKTGERPRLIHRLDKDTSGVLLLAKSFKTARYMSHLFQNHLIQKDYLAVIQGVPKPAQGVISGYMKKVKTEFGKEIMTLCEQKREKAYYSKTYYQLLDRLGKHLGLIQLSPMTGRTHQLRLHMQALNCPILGDYKYGLRTSGKREKLHLHARRIEYISETHKKIKIEADLPEHMKKTCQNLNFDPID